MPLLNDMPLERANQIFRHPIHQDAVALVQLITALRQWRSAEYFYDFQQDLLARVLEGSGTSGRVSAGREAASARQSRS